MRRVSALAVAAVVALALALAACGGDGDDGGDDTAFADARPRIDGDPSVIDAALSRVIDESYPEVPGEIVEIIMGAGPDDIVVIHLEAPVAELDWNIHGHDDGGTQTIFEELNVMSADYTFIPPHETDWFLLLRNSGPTEMTVEVDVEVYGEITWSPQ